jgi:formylglycine-generating enzyme required for sulfatase activity
MLGSLVRFAVVGVLTLGASAALLDAAGDDCVHASACSEAQVDERGCCRELQDADHGIIMVTRKQRAASVGCPADMVHVPGGSFLMGSRPGEGEDDERPQHRVTLSGYCLDRTEVPVAAYSRCVTAHACTPAPAATLVASSAPEFASLCNGTRADRAKHPINCVDWNQASAYCASVGKRLPSEAEWEYAAVGRDEQLYPWGNEQPSAERLNVCGSECRPLLKRLGGEAASMYEASDTWETTAPVGSFPHGASPFGALDMAGNVAEWTGDTYGGYKGTPSAFKDGPHRVFRGSAWTETVVSRVRGASRDSANPMSRAVNLGFRCARAE